MQVFAVCSASASGHALSLGFKHESVLYMSLENIAHFLCAIENYHIFSTSLFIIFYLLHAIAVKMS